jgi:acyl-coenzyme A thioesterase PaaI-like protein
MGPELAQVLKGLALNRRPGWNFPGNFLDLSFDDIAADGGRVSLQPGPHCIDGDGQVDLGALAILADIGMATAMRPQVGLATRMATVAMSLSLTGAPRTGRLEAVGKFDGFVVGGSGSQGLTRGEIFSEGTLVATGAAIFVALGSREGMAPLPLRRRQDELHMPALTEAELTEAERAVYSRAQAALRAGEGGSFIERFWGFLPRRGDPDERGGADATCDFTNGLHVGNRVGHTQGGVTFALAATTAMAALDSEWQLVGTNAWFVAPGTGEQLRCESSVVHRGTLTAVVRSRIADGQGRAVLEAVTQHSRRQSP